jgi:hypothetical protein
VRECGRTRRGLRDTGLGPQAQRGKSTEARHTPGPAGAAPGRRLLRSLGLGKSDPPLSIVVDDLGIYYDAQVPSRLEALVATPLTMRNTCGRKPWSGDGGLPGCRNTTMRENGSRQGKSSRLLLVLPRRLPALTAVPTEMPDSGTLRIGGRPDRGRRVDPLWPREPNKFSRHAGGRAERKPGLLGMAQGPPRGCRRAQAGAFRSYRSGESSSGACIGPGCASGFADRACSGGLCGDFSGRLRGLAVGQAGAHFRHAILCRLGVDAGPVADAGETSELAQQWFGRTPIKHCRRPSLWSSWCTLRS